MLILVLCFLYTTLAEPIAYSRAYLRGLKHAENMRLQVELINRGSTYLEGAIIIAAKKGLTQYTTEEFLGCDGPSELIPYGMEKTTCENIVNGIRAIISERFPDSEIIYDVTSRRYTLNWG